MEFLTNDLFIGAVIFMAGVIIGSWIRGKGFGNSTTNEGSVYLDVAGDYYEISGDNFSDGADINRAVKVMEDPDS